MNYEYSQKTLKRRTIIDKIISNLFLVICLICAAIIFIIVAFILIRGIQPFFKEYKIGGNSYKIMFSEFLFGNRWDFLPNHFGAGFIILNTIYITILSMVIAIPTSLFSSIFIVRIIPNKIKPFFQLIIELLASIPSIIYGLFGQAIITKFVISISSIFNIQTLGGQSILSTSIVLGMMTFPTITMVSINAMKAVKKELIEGSLALGASMTQTNFKVVLSGAKNGIFSGIILGIGRALGEATAVSKVCGNATTGPSFSLFDSTSTLTTTILSGFSEASGMKYDIKFSLAIILVLIILLNSLILNVIKKRIGQ